ncbi:hypothetical protein JTB14_012419 [Gonioctena quinquepunctata]|nr:hypothetical protein JTB14_012419 [Gonioctena quinquepunctata]
MSDRKTKTIVDDIYELLKEANNNFSPKIENIGQDLKNISTKLNQEIEVIKYRVTPLENGNSELKKLIEDTERKLKLNNLIVYGMKGDEKERRQV